LPQDKLSEWLGLLNSQKIKSIRDRISIQRNKYFAHTDRSPKTTLNKAIISIEEINKLINLTESIMFDLKVYCFQTHSDFEVTGLERAGSILLAFNALKEKRQAKITKEWDEYVKERNKRSNH
jgi:hypothetical protein